MPDNDDTLASARRRFYITFTVIGVSILIIATLWAIGQIWTPISIILFSAFLVFILHTPVGFLERKGVPRIVGAALMYVVAILVIAAIALVFIPVIVEQFIDFAGMIPQYISDASTFFSQTFADISKYLQESKIQDIVSSLATELGKWASTVASDSAAAMIQMASSIGTIFLVAGVSIVVGFWILIDLPRFSKEVYKIVGPRHAEDVNVIAKSFSRALGGYLRGMVVSCLCTGTMSFIAYTICGLPYPAVMALFTGLMVFIPFIGPVVAWLLAGVIGLFISPLTGILAAVLTICSQAINDNVISPRVMGGSVELHPGIILIVIFIGSALGGVFGMLCAIPLTSAVKSIFVYYFEKRTGRQLVAEDGALFKGHPSSSSDQTQKNPHTGLSKRMRERLLKDRKKSNAFKGLRKENDTKTDDNSAEGSSICTKVDSEVDKTAQNRQSYHHREHPDAGKISEQGKGSGCDEATALEPDTEEKP